MGTALFANQREANLASTVALVEAVLGELGHEAADCRTKVGASLHAWQITKGSAVAKVSLIHRSEFSHLRVCSTVMTLDDIVDRLALYNHLLDLNSSMAGAAFATDGDHVLIVGERSTLDLDRSEVTDLIKRVTTYADEHDDVLVARFGGKLGEVAT